VLTGSQSRVIGGRIGWAGGASAHPLFSEKAVNIINTYTFILAAEYFSHPTFCILPPPLSVDGTLYLMVRGEILQELIMH